MAQATRLLWRGMRRQRLHNLIRAITMLQNMDAKEKQYEEQGRVPLYFDSSFGHDAKTLTAWKQQAQADLQARG